MRHSPLLAAFRGRDGRSLARALILLVLVNLFAGGLDAGAAATGGLTLCSAAESNDGGQPPAPHHDPDCRMAGTTPLGVGLAARPPLLLLPALDRQRLPPPEADRGTTSVWKLHATARGPPLVA